MVEKLVNQEGREEELNKTWVGEYLRWGSVDEVFRRNKYDLPISYPGFQRLLDKWGIVKAAGPNSKLSEAITFLVLLSDKKIPLETLYRSLPPSFKTSMATMHRILHNIKEGIVRRYGTALVITPTDDSEKILVADDVSTPRLELGKPFGSVSFPMGYSRGGEDARISILRVLQREVFTQKTINRNFPYFVIPRRPQPLMYFDIADVRVGVFHLRLPENLSKTSSFSSYKLLDHRYLHLTDFLVSGNDNKHFRAGLREMAQGYQKFLEGRSLAVQPATHCSSLNLALVDALTRYY